MKLYKKIQKSISYIQNSLKVPKKSEDYAKKFIPINKDEFTLSNTADVGVYGEKLARTYYEQLGYRFVRSNVHKRFGEIDLILQDGPTTVFCEVKTRTSDTFGDARETFTPKKQRRILRMIQYYCLQNHIPEDRVRADFVAIQIQNEGAALHHFANIELA